AGGRSNSEPVSPPSAATTWRSRGSGCRRSLARDIPCRRTCRSACTAAQPGGSDAGNTCGRRPPAGRPAVRMAVGAAARTSPARVPGHVRPAVGSVLPGHPAATQICSWVASSAMDDLTLLTVHAHPDDEASKGAPTCAKYHALGVRTVLVCCTGGEEGDLQNLSLREEGQRLHGLEPADEKAAVIAMRPDELRRSAEV